MSDIEELFKGMMGDNPDYEVLAVRMDAYYDRMYKLMAILYFANGIDPSLGENMSKKFLPIIEMLTEKVNAAINEYQEKHGEL
jgi:hypothetical protein